LTSREKLVRYYFLLLFLIFIFFSISIQVTYGSNFNKIIPILRPNTIGYTDSKNGFQELVSLVINQNRSNGIELVGNVTYVVDGDTLDINGIRIRLSLVDTPERGHPGYKEAKEFVKSLCLGKNGELDVDDGQRRGDRFGRELGVVYCDGVNMNEKLMDNHLAKIFTEYCDVSEFSTEVWARSHCLKPK
jgi:micrococcal nuclease